MELANYKVNNTQEYYVMGKCMIFLREGILEYRVGVYNVSIVVGYCGM